jgi:hypothetical protein
MRVVEDGKEAKLEEKRTHSVGFGGLPDLVADPSSRRAQAELRGCDAAAEKLADLILGCPAYHPLLKDAEARLAELRTFMDQHVPHLRRATRAERIPLDRAHEVAYVLDIRPNEKVGATRADIDAGRAIFHLDGRGTPLDAKLPAYATFKKDLPPEGRQPTEADVEAGRARFEYGTHYQRGEKPSIVWSPPRSLVMQAERAPDGTVWYGIVERRGMRKVAADEMGPLQTPEADDAGN